MNTRALATQLITEVLTDGRSLSHSLPEYKIKCQKPEEAAFLQALVFGVIRWYPRLQFISEQLLQKPIKPKEIEIYYLILIGLYQLTDMRIPAHAAISETVETTRVLNKPWAASLVNAVLRSYQRQAETIQAAIPTSDQAYYAHPLWLIQTLKKAWGNEWKSILEQNNTQAPLSLRVNVLKSSRENYLERLKTAAILATPILHTQAGIMLQTPMEVTKLPGFSEGFISVQDGAAQLAAPLLQLAPNQRVLDACAAPGGKTTQILEIEPKLAELVALDLSMERTQLIHENLNRLGLSATVKTGNANQPDTWWDGNLFDRILLDAPCSATGVIRRHPDIKYLRRLSDINQLTELQMQLLNSLWPLLKPGGILLYATCSIFPDENTHLMQSFLSDHSNAKPLSMPAFLASNQPIGQQILPGQNGMDGFYYALIEKGVN